MSRTMARRAFLHALPAGGSIAALLPLAARSAGAAPPDAAAIPAAFPAQDPARVKEMVGVSHGNAARVRELLGESPALAKAAWDWGFGDWETALGAASHMGNVEIARLLIDAGARPDLFTFAMLGHLDVVKAYVAANPGIQRLAGPHGLTLMHHARKGGEAAAGVVQFLDTLGDADLKPESQALSEEVMAACAGKYAFAPGEDGVFDVYPKDGMLWIKRLPAGTGRSLFHLGDRVFHPVGAPAVRIRFAGDGAATASLTVEDGPSSITARKNAG